jgi:hypothetical protein
MFIMSCCGQKRSSLNKASYENFPVNQVQNEGAEKKRFDSAIEYTGQSALTVIGSVTGKKYRFSHPGAVLLIDYRDASGMLAIPTLKKWVDKSY